MLFEDGRGRADVVPGDRLFAVIRPRPSVLLLAACYSEAVLSRARDAADWKDGAIVSVQGDKADRGDSQVPGDVLARAAQGRAGGEAFDAARNCVDSDPALGALSAAPGEVPPAQTFRLNDAGRTVRLEASANGPAESLPGDPPRRSALIRRASSRFVGRRREMAGVIDALLRLPPGMANGPGDAQRLVTITKEVARVKRI